MLLKPVYDFSNCSFFFVLVTKKPQTSLIRDFLWWVLKPLLVRVFRICFKLLVIKWSQACWYFICNHYDFTWNSILLSFFPDWSSYSLKVKATLFLWTLLSCPVLYLPWLSFMSLKWLPEGHEVCWAHT